MLLVMKVAHQALQKTECDNLYNQATGAVKPHNSQTVGLATYTGNQMEKCPFKVGEKVVYMPTFRGRGLFVMTDLAVLEPRASYTISRIDDDVYIVVEGFENAVPSGIYWTEFKSERIEEVGRKGTK